MEQTSTLPQILLHIGMPKTGTSAIQHFLSVNHLKLIKYHILYPLQLGQGKLQAHLQHRISSGNGFNLARALLTGNQFHQYIYQSPEGLLLRRLLENNRDTKNKIVISSEFFSGNLTNNRIRLLHQLFNFGYGYDLKLVYYLRNPIDYFNSIYIQLLKSNHINFTPEEFMKELLQSGGRFVKGTNRELVSFNYLMFHSFYKELISELGLKENILIFKYEDCKTPSVVEHFLNNVLEISYDKNSNFIFSEWFNMKISPTLVNFFLWLNKKYPSDIKVFQRFKLQKMYESDTLGKFGIKRMNTKYYILPIKYMRELFNRYLRNEIRSFIQEFDFSIFEDYLRVDWHKYQEQLINLKQFELTEKTYEQLLNLISG